MSGLTEEEDERFCWETGVGSREVHLLPFDPLIADDTHALHITTELVRDHLGKTICR